MPRPRGTWPTRWQYLLAHTASPNCRATSSPDTQVGRSVQTALLSPYLLVIGVPFEWYSLVCLCGPVSGLLIQPYLGAFSDHCTSSMGRRRPFIIGCAFFTVVGFLLMSNATFIGHTVHGGEEKPLRMVLYLVVPFSHLQPRWSPPCRIICQFGGSHGGHRGPLDPRLGAERSNRARACAYRRHRPSGAAEVGQLAHRGLVLPGERPGLRLLRGTMV